MSPARARRRTPAPTTLEGLVGLVVGPDPQHHPPVAASSVGGERAPSKSV
jgi:hypothetical protein